MIFKKNKINIFSNSYYYSVEELKEIFKKIPNNLPSYFKTIPKKTWDLKFNNFNMNINTIRSCAGFLNLFKRTMLMKCPYDLQLIFEDNEVKGQIGGEVDGLERFIDLHSNDQFLNYIPHQDNYKYVVKIKTNIHFNTNVPFMLSQPFFHFANHEVVPGILPSNSALDLNIFILIKKETKSLIIKKHDPLAYLTFLCSDEIIFKYSNKIREPKFRSTFSVLKDYVLNKI